MIPLDFEIPSSGFMTFRDLQIRRINEIGFHSIEKLVALLLAPYLSSNVLSSSVVTHRTGSFASLLLCLCIHAKHSWMPVSSGALCFLLLVVGVSASEGDLFEIEVGEAVMHKVFAWLGVVFLVIMAGKQDSDACNVIAPRSLTLITPMDESNFTLPSVPSLS